MSGTAATGLGTWLVDWLPLAMAGGVGAACRWCVDTSVSRLSNRVVQDTAAGAWQRRRPGVRAPRIPQTPSMLRMPWGTVVVNVTACLLMGLLMGLLVGRAGGPPRSGSWAAAALTVLGTGFLGGYSTFSTACLEAARLLLDGRGGAALMHALAMTAGTLLAAVVGMAVGMEVGMALGSTPA